jgi:protocatechuate 3,4-dioxygenase beta subunit
MNKDISRRSALKVGLAAGVIASAKVSHAASHLAAAQPTPNEIEGPFYPAMAQKDTDFDLTVIEGQTQSAEGEVILIEGTVVDTKGQAVSDATVDLWQACASGRYNHPHDSNPAPKDPRFQGWAIVPSGAKGGFRFKTITPGAYPAAPNWMRPPHIHFKVSKRGYIELVTQMYFQDHPLNEKDKLLKRKSADEQALMIAKKVSADPITFKYTIVLQEA